MLKRLTVVLLAFVRIIKSDCNSTCYATNGELDYTQYHSYDGCCDHNISFPNVGRINFDNIFVIGAEGQSYCSAAVPYACSATNGGYPAQRSVTNGLQRQALEYKADFGLNVMHVLFGQWLNHELNEGARGACTTCPTITNKIVDYTNDELCYWNTCNRCALIKNSSLCSLCFGTTVPAYCEALGVTDDCRANTFLSTLASCQALATTFTLTGAQAAGSFVDGYFVQKNLQTSYLDLDSVYGTSRTASRRIRTLGVGGVNIGELKTGSYPLLQSVNYYEYELVDSTVTMTDLFPSRADLSITSPQGGSPDNFPDKYDWYTPKPPNLDVLTAGLFSITFLREHNRLARYYYGLDPTLTDEQVYQKARRINIATLQKIVMKDWLGTLLGPDAYDELVGDYTGYNSSSYPQSGNIFVHGALRYGHHMFDDWIPLDECGNRQTVFNGIERRDNVNQVTLLSDTMLEFDYTDVNQAINAHWRALIGQNALRFDPTVSSRIRNFAGSQFVQVDLAAVDLSRNRLHGVPPYLKARQRLLNDLPSACEKVLDFEAEYNSKKLTQYTENRAKCLNWLTRNNTKTITIDGQSLAARLDSLYTNLSFIDFNIGLLAEYPAYETTNVGITLATIFGKQFNRIRSSDRLWYENPGVFTTAELDSIESRTLGDLLTDNYDFEDTFNTNVFVKPPDFDLFIKNDVCV